MFAILNNAVINLLGMLPFCDFSETYNELYDALNSVIWPPFVTALAAIIFATVFFQLYQEDKHPKWPSNLFLYLAMPWISILGFWFYQGNFLVWGNLNKYNGSFNIDDRIAIMVAVLVQNIIVGYLGYWLGTMALAKLSDTKIPGLSKLWDPNSKVLPFFFIDN